MQSTAVDYAADIGHLPMLKDSEGYHDCFAMIHAQETWTVLAQQLAHEMSLPLAAVRNIHGYIYVYKWSATLHAITCDNL